ncbi:metalloprotease PmbA [Methylonatrum kenyense]|uniref:metalloprotease PmbA n=1 Tax=Methylonatrum kenyense TaxID=455253 RepID=UPI0020BD87C7|nr:metalloprotease PmbA [Methylonatrum kenyense]MCK8516250.1 metalloprotease PmbA [Methylonatrum kenyense]
MNEIVESVNGAQLADEQRLIAIGQQVLEEARGQGASAAEASISVGTGLSVSVRRGEVDTLEHERDRSLAVVVYMGQRSGAASTADFSPRSLQATVAAACSIARYTSEDPARGLADPALLATDFPDLDLHHPWPLSADQAIERALAAEASARDADSRISDCDSATVTTGEGIRVYLNSNGFVGSRRGTRHGVSCIAIARDDAGMQRDYWFSVARSADELESPADVGRRAGERAASRLGSRRLQTGRVPVLYTPMMARGVIGQFLGAISGGNLYRKSSFLLDRLGEQVFPAHVQMQEHPHRPRGLASAAFDDEGVATRDCTVVEDGRLQTYLLDSYAGRRLGRQSTGHAGGVHNLEVRSGDKDFTQLLRTMDSGLVVTELMGQGGNLVTGDYSRGAAGFWVENGEIAYPVEEITVAGNLRDMFAGLQAVGADRDERGSIITGSLLFEQMTVAGK